jgi:hypothetical protein
VKNEEGRGKREERRGKNEEGRGKRGWILEKFA